jgi:hypothetical protein
MSDKNKIYLLERIETGNDEAKDDPWAGMQVDVAVGMVVSAVDAINAREVAGKHCGDEGLRAWHDENWTTLKCISQETSEPVGLVLRNML